MKTNKELMTEARKSLANKWGLAIITFFIYGLILKVAGPIGIIIGGPMQLGVAAFSLNISRGKSVEIGQIFDGFKKFEKPLVAYLLVLLFVLLWSLLFIIPGIIAAISYSQTFFLLADNDSLSATEAMGKSQKLMKGKKWKFFCLGLRFIGWFILSILTFGIGFLWLIPYVEISYAKFYDDIK